MRHTLQTKKFHFTILFILIIQVSAIAQKKLPFQGKLIDNGTEYTGTADFEFSITSPSWSETLTDVTVQDGYYSIILGETTPLPDNLFSDSDEITLNISVDGQALTAATLYAPLIDPTMDDTGLAVYGPNGNLNNEIKNRGSGLENQGGFYAYDTDGKLGAYMDGRDGGGRLATWQVDDGDSFIQSSWLIGHQANGLGFLNGYGLNKAETGSVKLVDMFMTDRDRFGAVFSDGYRRSGVDFYDNEGTELAFIGGQKNQAGGGKAGQMILFGQSTANVFFNALLESGDGDLPFFRMYGQNDDGGSWYMSNIEFNTIDLSGDTGADINLLNTSNGSADKTIFLSSYDGTSGGGKIEVADNGGAVSINIDGGSGTITATTVTESSDARLKKNIQPLTNALEDMLALQGVTYQWKDQNRSQNQQIGFIAQEVEKTFPQFVHTDSEGMKSVNYAQMTAVLVEAMKEMNQKIEELEIQNKKLSAENSTLKVDKEAFEKLASDVQRVKDLLNLDVTANK